MVRKKKKAGQEEQRALVLLLRPSIQRRVHFDTAPEVTTLQMLPVPQKAEHSTGFGDPLYSSTQDRRGLREPSFRARFIPCCLHSETGLMGPRESCRKSNFHSPVFVRSRT